MGKEKTFLVTGGGGFLGFEICSQLRACGHKVINFSRNHHAKLDTINVETIKGDLRVYQDLVDALSNVDGVFHVAAKAGVWGDRKEFFDINYQGTLNLLKACQFQKIQYLVYTSTPSVVSSIDDHCNELDPPYPKKFYCDYAESKALAEQAVRENSFTRNVSIRPHLIFGKDDPHIIPRLIQKHSRIKIVGSGENLVDVIHVKNAAHAHVLAMDKLVSGMIDSGKAYFVGQERPVKLWDFINKIYKAYKLSAIEKQISFELAFFAGARLEQFYRLLRIYKYEPPMSRFVAIQLAKSHYFDLRPAQRELGYMPIITIEDALGSLN